MSTGQMLMTLGAITLLMIIIFRVNSGFLTTNEILHDNKYGILAVSIATSIIEEAKGRAFDSYTASNPAVSTSQLTSVGPGYGEVYPDFNDFDDYDGLDIIDSTLASAQFRIQCEVDYVNANDPDNPVTPTRTWHKRIMVTVTSPFMNDTVWLSSVYSYFYFR